MNTIDKRKRKRKEEPQLPLTAHYEAPSADTLKPQVSTIIEGANAIVIKSHEDNEKAGALLQGIKAMRKKVAELLDPVVASAHAAWKKAIALRDSFDDPLARVETDVKGKVRDFLQEQERLRLAEEQRKNAEAEAKAEEDALLMEAIGDSEAAEEIRQEPVAPVVISPVAKPEGVTIAANWKFRIIDASLIPREFLKVDEVKLGQVVRAMKEATDIPGVEAYDAGSVRVR